jgi:hypothetical protein
MSFSLLFFRYTTTFRGTFATVPISTHPTVQHSEGVFDVRCESFSEHLHYTSLSLNGGVRGDTLQILTKFADWKTYSKPCLSVKCSLRPKYNFSRYEKFYLSTRLSCRICFVWVNSLLEGGVTVDLLLY